MEFSCTRLSGAQALFLEGAAGRFQSLRYVERVDLERLTKHPHRHFQCCTPHLPARATK